MIDTTDALWSCHRKRRYTTAAAAQAAATYCWERRRVSLRVYPCEHCGGHHLTHTDAPEERPGWRPPEKSKRQLAAERRRRRRGRR